MSKPSGAAARSDVSRAHHTHRWRAVLAGIAVLWVVLLFASPRWARAATVSERPGGQALIAAVVWSAGHRVCHQRPERSFHLHGTPMAVCGRCTGLYVSGAAAMLAGSLTSRRKPSPRRSTRSTDGAEGWPAIRGRVTLDPRARLLAIAAVPTLLTWSLEMAGVWDPGTMMRAAAAVPLGAAAGWFIARAMDD